MCGLSIKIENQNLLSLLITPTLNMPPAQESNDLLDTVYTTSLNYLRLKLPAGLSHPKVAIICGSGLGGLVDIIDEADCKKVEFKYEDIPGFVSSTG